MVVTGKEARRLFASGLRAVIRERREFMLARSGDWAAVPFPNRQVRNPYRALRWARGYSIPWFRRGYMLGAILVCYPLKNIRYPEE